MGGGGWTPTGRAFPWGWGEGFGEAEPSREDARGGSGEPVGSPDGEGALSDSHGVKLAPCIRFLFLGGSFSILLFRCSFRPSRAFRVHSCLTQGPGRPLDSGHQFGGIKVWGEAWGIPCSDFPTTPFQERSSFRRSPRTKRLGARIVAIPKPKRNSPLYLPNPPTTGKQYNASVFVPPAHSGFRRRPYCSSGWPLLCGAMRFLNRVCLHIPEIPP